MSLADTLRPPSLDDVIGHDQHKPAIKYFVNKKCRYWLFSGATGSGKTSLARIVARQIIGGLDEPSVMDLVEINAADIGGVDSMREWVAASNLYTMQGNYRAIIVDEAHMLSTESKTLLLKPFEQESGVTAWILCTMSLKDLPEALVHRCVAHFHLDGMGPQQHRQLIMRAANRMNFPGDIAKFLDGHKNTESARQLLNQFEHYALRAMKG